MKIVLVGDTALAREPASRVDRPVLTGDLVIANLEAPLVDEARPAEKEMTIRLPTSAATLFRGWGIDVVSLATNHALDHGPEGLFSTMRALDDAGVRHAGGGRTLTEADAGVVVEVDGTRVAVLSFCSTLPPGANATATRPGIAPLRIDQSFAVDGTLAQEQPGTPPFVRSVAQEADVRRVEQRVRTARTEADRVVVCLHWGVPFAYLPPNQGPLAQYQQNLGRRLVDAGADVVAGTHPHCLHPVERWNEGLILYSLGNFLFHQGEIQQPDTFFGLPYRASRLFEGTPWFDSAVFEVDLPAEGAPRLRIAPITLDAAGEPRVADPDAAARIRALVEESSREIDPTVQVDADGVAHFGAPADVVTRMSRSAVDDPQPAS
ncbi:CapA family protein [Pseudonocardia halophobica]|uniref:Capsular polysaccharide biosynthesis protein n=1 Tax=Pseudonocardia halophobica TaxID=29401 RepID=A0A9W6L5I2_9PSEU|nr:CapA family protein [Pseudonocardia halophobica]GLL13613.1 capsular polysaccharide biosynthesis protein [Pseudonocardia halophobica]